MKKILLLVTTLFTLCANAQSDQAPDMAQSVDGKNILYKVVPIKLRIRDKIYIQNKSPYYILQIVVAVPLENGDLEPLGSSTYISPNETFELASFKSNALRKLKGKTIAIKAKGAKVFMGGQNRTNVWTPYGSVGVNHKDLDPEIINKIKPEDITYNFDVRFYEDRHDLYIEVFNAGENGAGVMDF